MDKRRIEVSSGNPGISLNFIDVDFEQGQVVNVHGYRCMVAMEPENADANANGIMAIYRLPGGVIQNSDLPASYGEFGDEKWAPYLWGITPFACSNQTPFYWDFAPKTSRTIQEGGRIVLDILVNGLSAGLIRINTVQTMFTSAVK